VSAIARSNGLDPSQLFTWRRKAIASGVVAPLDGSPSRPVRFTGFEAIRSDTVEIVIGDVVVRAGGDIEPDRRADVIRCGSQVMIPAGVQVYVASMPVDFRKGTTGLMALVRDGGADPFSGALYVFRSKRADRIKAVWFDGTGVCLFAKTLEDARFCWPRIGPATLQLNHAQLLALVDGLDWKKVRPVDAKRPQSMG